MSTLEAGLDFGSSVLALTNDVLDRVDRDSLKRDLDNDEIETHNAIGTPGPEGLTRQYELMDRLFTNVGFSPTPTGAMGAHAAEFADLEFRKNAFLIAAQLRYAQRIISRLVAQRIKE